MFKYIIVFILFLSACGIQYPKNEQEALVLQEATYTGYKAIKWEHLEDTPCLTECFDELCYDFATKACGKILLKEI